MSDKNTEKQHAAATKKKLTVIVAVVVAIIAIILGFMACTNNPAPNSADSQSLAASQSVQTSQAQSSSPDAVKEYLFEVTHKDGTTTKKTLTTTETTLDKALLDAGLVAGDEGEYGLFVTEVDGEAADYSTDGGWWKFLVNGEESSVGVSTTNIENGSIYSFVYTVD